jgi:hypothetical protein
VRYPYPIHLFLGPARRILFGISSPPSRDARLLLKDVDPPPRVLNADNIPATGPFVLTMNHYDHPHLGAWWSAAVVISTVAGGRAAEPRELHMAMAREWWYPSGLGRAIKQPLTQWFFGRLAETYGLIRLPPVLPNPEFRGQGTIEIRRALALTRGDRPQLVGLAPEGRTGKDLSLCQPPPGTGLFLLLLTHDAMPCLPVGVFEDDDSVLTVRFGPPFPLHVPRNTPREARDRAAARTVMVEIGKLLPPRMWGEYSEDLTAGDGE